MGRRETLGVRGAAQSSHSGTILSDLTRQRSTYTDVYGVRATRPGTVGRAHCSPDHSPETMP